MNIISSMLPFLNGQKASAYSVSYTHLDVYKRQGCTVSIVKNDAVETFVEQVGKGYKEQTGHEAEFYVVEIGDGARRL